MFFFPPGGKHLFLVVGNSRFGPRNIRYKNVPSTLVERILEDPTYAARHPALNKVVFAQLLLATVEGTAYHLVHKHKDDINRNAAWELLKEWYDGNVLKYETVEQL